MEVRIFGFLLFLKTKHNPGTAPLLTQIQKNIHISNSKIIKTTRVAMTFNNSVFTQFKGYF